MSPSAEGTTYPYDYRYHFDDTISGLGTEEYTLVGMGRQACAWEVTSSGNTSVSNLAMEWESIGDGVTLPAWPRCLLGFHRLL